jgi:hypothetical protein
MENATDSVTRNAADGLTRLTVPQLNGQCRALNLLVGGRKAEIIARLQAHDDASATDDCVVCYRDMSACAVARLPCSHELCVRCLIAIDNKTCPMCRCSIRAYYAEFVDEVKDIPTPRAPSLMFQKTNQPAGFRIREETPSLVMAVLALFILGALSSLV